MELPQIDKICGIPIFCIDLFSFRKNEGFVSLISLNRPGNDLEMSLNFFGRFEPHFDAIYYEKVIDTICSASSSPYQNVVSEFV